MTRMIAIRDAYGEALKKLGAQDSRVVALEADVGGSSKSILFGQAFPDRYFNVGIAENNMSAMAAGLATIGFIPFINTFASFMINRGGDPLQNLAAYDKLNVKFAGTYCGLSDSYDGASHHSISDIAFVRALPNMTILSVCDAVETEKAVFAAAAHDGPVYLRLSRAPAPVLFDDKYVFEIGKGVVLREGGDVTVIATGAMVHEALIAAELLANEGIHAKVIDIHTIQPIDQELLVRCAKQTGAVVIAEEHSVRGGLGSAVAEVLAEAYPVPMGFIGLRDFAESGDYTALQQKYGLDGKAIAAKCKTVLKR